VQHHSVFGAEQRVLTIACSTWLERGQGELWKSMPAISSIVISQYARNASSLRHLPISIPRWPVCYVHTSLLLH